MYLDGRRDPEICGQAEIGYPAGCGQLFLGGRNDGFAPLEGKLDEVSIYSRALSADGDCGTLCFVAATTAGDCSKRLRGDPREGRQRPVVRAGSCGGQAAGGLAAERRVFASTAQERAFRHKWL